MSTKPVGLRFWFALLTLAVPSHAHTLEVGYNESSGAFSITFDNATLLRSGYPLTIGFLFINGTQPPWDWMRTPFQRSFDASTRTYTLEYPWGQLHVQHVSDAKTPLQLDMVISVTAAKNSSGMTSGTFGVHGDEVYWASNASGELYRVGSIDVV